MQRTAWRVVAIIWLCLVARGAFYVVLLPIWEGYDEWAHVAYAQLLASGQGLPVLGRTVISREVAESLELAPLPHGHPSMTGTRLTHDSFWRISEPERDLRRRSLLALPRGWAAEPAVEKILNHEAQQPPFYYLLLAPIQLAAGQASLPARVWLMRLASLLLTSLTIPLAFLAARRVLGSDAWAVGATALIAAMPGFLMSASRVGNDGLSAVIFTALLYVLLLGDRPWLTGLLLGAGLLTKASFLTAIPAVGVVYVWRWLSSSGSRGRVAGQVSLTFLISIAISGWWYWRNYRLTGTWSGLQQVVARGDLSIWSLVGAIVKVDWMRFFDIAFVSHIWSGNWSFLQLRSWVYRIFAIIVLAAVAGLMAKPWRKQSPNSDLLALGSLYGFFWLGLCYHELTFHLLGLSSAAGWYVYAVVASEVLLAVTGLQAWFPKRWCAKVSPAVSGLFVLLDLYAAHFVLLPYYTGLIAHRRSGALAAFQVERLAELPVMLGRLSASMPAAWLLWIGYVAATLALPLLSHARKHQTRDIHDQNGSVLRSG